MPATLVKVYTMQPTVVDYYGRKIEFKKDVESGQAVAELDEKVAELFLKRREAFDTSPIIPPKPKEGTQRRLRPPPTATSDNLENQGGNLQNRTPRLSKADLQRKMVDAQMRIAREQAGLPDPEEEKKPQAKGLDPNSTLPKMNKTGEGGADVVTSKPQLVTPAAVAVDIGKLDAVQAKALIDDIEDPAVLSEVEKFENARTTPRKTVLDYLAERGRKIGGQA